MVMQSTCLRRVVLPALTRLRLAITRLRLAITGSAKLVLASSGTCTLLDLPALTRVSAGKFCTTGLGLASGGKLVPQYQRTRTPALNRLLLIQR